jgi:hypothetical protein
MTRILNGSAKALQCSKEDLRIHIEALMSPAMLWSDYGKLWEIDHIVPFAALENGEPPTDQVKLQRMHYTNLQPLWSWQHHEKSANERKVNV